MMKRSVKLIIASLLAVSAFPARAGQTVRFSPDTETVLRNPLNGWVMYLRRNWDENF